MAGSLLRSLTFGRIFPLLCGLFTAAACDRDNRDSKQIPHTAVPKGPPSPQVPPFTRQPGGARIVAIGDLHGDVLAARAALRLSGAVDAEDRWNAGSLIVVQTGDLLDRGDDEREMVDLFDRLGKEARAAGGALIALNGNHEVMNLQGDFRYVTPGGFRDFESVARPSPLAARISGPERGRAAAFLPGGEYARRLAEGDVIAVVGDTVFAHGGVLEQHVRYGLDRLNRETRSWMTGHGSPPDGIFDEHSPVWTRDYGAEVLEPSACRELDRVLGALSAKRLVVGHTVQKSGISAACGDKVYRIDVGMARYYGDNPIQVLEIAGARVQVLSAPRATLLGSPDTKSRSTPKAVTP